MGRGYGPQRFVIAAAGRLEHKRVVQLVAEAFDALPGKGATDTEPADYRGGEYREERDLEQVHLVLGFDAVNYREPDYYPALVLSTLFGGGMSSRLFQEVREKRGLVYSIYSFVSAYRDGGLFGIYAGTGAEQVTELLPVVCDELKKLGQQVDEEEVQRARAQLKASILMGRESTGARAEQLAQQILAYGRPLQVEEIVAKVEAVDAEIVCRLSRSFTVTHPTLTVLGPIAKVESFDRLVTRLS